jgi:hypothetical protein
MRRSLSVFGTYAVDEDKKTVTYRIVSSSFPGTLRARDAASANRASPARG